MSTGYLITARLKSTRLKRKILLDIDGDTVLDKVIKRCKQVNNVDKIVLCTSSNFQDEELETYAQKHNIYFFRGSEDDVLGRLLNAAQFFKIDKFLSITADNPLHSILVGEKILKFDSKNSCDFIFSHNLPIGISPYFIRTKALEVAVFMKDLTDTEIWGPFVNRPDFFKIGNIHFNNNKLSKNIRITCDYQEDYDFIIELYNNIKKDYPDINDIDSLFTQNPNIFNINAGITQRTLEAKLLMKIKKSFDKNIANGKIFASENNIKLASELIENTINLYP